MEFDFSKPYLKEVDEFDIILNKMKFEREQEASRKKIKL